MTFKVKDGLALGAVTILDASGNVTVPEKLTLSNASTARSSLNVGNGTADPISPVDGDVWINSGVLKMRQSGATKNIAYTDSNITGTATKASNIVGGNATTLLGAIPYQSNTDATTLLSPNTTTTKRFLRQTGTGTNGAAPAWDILVDGDVPAALTGKTYNKVTITAPATGSTLTIADGKTLTANNTLTLTGTDASSVAFGSGGTVAYTSNKLNSFASTTSAELAGVISDETGSGSLVFANSPSLTTPSLGAASATSVNKVTITAPATGSTLTIADGKTLSVSNSITITGTDASSVAFGAGGTVAYTANKLNSFAATTSAELAGVISDETGSGALVFGTSPTFTTDITTPLVKGSAAASGSLQLTSTSNVTKGTVFVGGTGDTVRLNTTTNGFVKVSGANGTVSYDTNSYYAVGGTDVPVTDGGTGTSAAPAAGGIIYGASTSAYASTPAGTAGAILTSGAAAAPTWTTATYPSTIAVGDLLYGSALNTVSKLPIGLSGRVLRSNGTNVSWELDVNTFPDTWTWAAGTTAGPTATISGTSPDIAVAAIPAASATASGVITTGVQTIAGVKTFSSTIVGTINNANTAAATAQSVTFNNGGTGNGSGTTFNGGSAITVSYNTVGASASNHVHGQITNDGKIGATANLPLITTTAGEIATGAFGTASSALGTSGPGSANTFARSDHVHAMITSQAGTAGTIGTVNISGTTVGVTLGTTSTSASRGDHAHGQISNTGAIGTVADLPIKTTASGVLNVGAWGTVAGTFCQGNDARLSDARTPVSHVHGNITNVGAIGTVADLPIKTTASGVLNVGAWGTVAGTFCQGNDARLSDARAANGGTAAMITINYNNDTNASYQMLWGSGTSVYGTGGVTINPSTDVVTMGGLTLSAGVSTSITMGDSDNGDRTIHNNSNQIGFLTQAGAWGAYCDDSGNWTAAGDITAFSDERLKTDWEDLPFDFISQLATVKTGKYTRIDSGIRQVGVGAQSLQTVMPEAVLDGEYLSVAYGNAALSAAVMLARKVEELEARIAALEAK